MQDDRNPNRSPLNTDTYTIRSRYANLRAEVMIGKTEAESLPARLAAVLIEKWGMVAALPDGEDSAGRSRLRLQTPKEVVDRACEVSELAITEFRERGWMLNIPNLEEAEKILAQEKE